MCAQIVLDEGAVVVPDAAADRRFADLLMVREGCRFYAGTPLQNSLSGANLGALCIVVDAPRPAFDKTQREMLAGLAHLVTEELARRMSATAGTGRSVGGKAA
ncbi:GAF domain-containing protein [Lichenibacterium minor]|uniref:GAF domain-containing protein n=1 Tax=Lichenibacterium minor TaxID=2316528 RepID=UPI0013EA5F4A|nr:GAF domain-containing protein [Lichenibacterium minor]